MFSKIPHSSENSCSATHPGFRRITIRKGRKQQSGSTARVIAIVQRDESAEEKNLLTLRII